jgi:hypothetical protein
MMAFSWRPTIKLYIFRFSNYILDDHNNLKMEDTIGKQGTFRSAFTFLGTVEYNCDINRGIYP